MFDLSWISISEVNMVSFALGFVTLLTILNIYQGVTSHFKRKKAMAEMKEMRKDFKEKLEQFKNESSELARSLEVK